MKKLQYTDIYSNKLDVEAVHGDGDGLHEAELGW
jgi:hypothetical protein